ncbi:MAG: EamA family transporter [Gemmatimonadota bacterium]
MTPAAARLRILFTALLFSTGGAAIKAAHFTSWQTAGLRSGIAAIAVLLCVPASRKFKDRAEFGRAMLVGVAYAATLVLFVLANRLTTAANTIFLQAVAPLYILLLGPWLLKERITGKDWVVAAVMAVGMACFLLERPAISASAPDPAAGNLLATISGFSYAFLVIGMRWVARRGGSAAAPVALGNVMAWAVSLPMALPYGSHAATDWLVVVYLGVFQIGLAYALLSTAITVIPAFEASLLLMLEPVLNPVWAWLVQGERPGAWALAGAVAIMVAMVAKGWFDQRRPLAVAVPG